MEKARQNLLFVTHFKDIDDLARYKRDAPLEVSAENVRRLDVASQIVTQRVVENDRHALFFITSPKIRAIQTAEMLAQEVVTKSGRRIKVRSVVDDNLREIDQGDFVLPPNFKPGDSFDGLKLAMDIYLRETYGDSPGNLFYEFGDPVTLPDGSYKYPDLKRSFTKNGESTADTLIRFLGSLIEFSDKINKLDDRVEIVVIAHTLTSLIYQELSVLSSEIKTNPLSIEPGQLGFKLWEMFGKLDKSKIRNVFDTFEITDFQNTSLIEILRKEVEYLKSRKIS